MSYVEQNLGKNEKIVRKMDKNALGLIGSWIPGILLCFLIVPLVKAIANTIKFSKIELAFTNKRVIGKVGVIKTASLDAPLNKIQNISVKYTFWGKIFNAGIVTINTAAGELVFFYVKNADAFKSALMAQVDQYEEDRVKQQASEMAAAMKGAIGR